MKTISLKRKRAIRVRAKSKILGSRPRLSVFRSNKYIYAQIIDDKKGKTLVAVSEKNLSGGGEKKETKIEKAQKLGRLLAKKALDEKIKAVTFDRGGYRYHGRVRALAEGAREEGLSF